MTRLRMAPEVLEALIKIGGVTTRVKDAFDKKGAMRSEEHTSELQSQ